MTQRRILRNAIPWAFAAAVGLGLLATADLATAGDDGRTIMDKVATTRKLAGSEAVVKMRIMDGSQTRERKLSMATKLFDNGKTEKRVYKFIEPVDVKGTSILVFDYLSQADDLWIYLPALRKTRRIVGTETSKAFMGSEFSYGDLNIPPLDNYNYAVKGEEQAGGEACTIVECTPKTPAIAQEDGYQKKVYWVSKATYVVRKGHLFGLDGKLLKEATYSDVKLLDPANKRYRAMKMEMVNKQNGRRSVFETEKVAFTPNTSDESFTTRFLERQ
ncbi:MAG: outer membrane lipoprotein-sorting protein [Polyangiaceae bacterium]|nr:outer membrane lipoprotein-sorting protein [Polyangiaceae bacterium]